MNIAALVTEIEERVRAMPVRNTPAQRLLRREYSKRIAALSVHDVIQIAAGLIAHQRVHRFVGDELIAKRSDALAILDRALLERLGSTLSSWDQVDSFACYLSGPAWRERQVEDETIAD
jgi:hypothetical protein